ncbi:conjugal transfer protein TrbI [Nostocaceae cyanobacterium CENA369]|uniref:Conjugal transfer protein TrbI n=2 Tax=Nostocaceae TaxID=1162 RepID=A0A367RP47_9NOSO|nr:conjugal transfer protein TrbI [Dendronalium phyllosphericum]MBH8576369.1 conjugal transfer protein TrbI [Dendronalium phyllosphericum CENA369]RCJ38337.1 conjugal transfer protein TrbI [Nostoc minutum NIES-26]
MTRLHQWKSGTAALMTMAIATSAVIPMIAVAPANAQYNIGQSRTVTIPSGVNFPVKIKDDKVTVKPGDTKSLTLRIANDIIDSNRNILIPRNTEVVGQLEPVNLGSYSRDRDYGQGVRFVARELVFSNGQRQSINATSQTFSTTERVSQGPSSSRVLTDAAIGAGAGLLGSLVTGDRKINDIKPIIGAAAGAGASIVLRKTEGDAFVLRNQDLRLTLNSNLVLYRY